MRKALITLLTGVVVFTMTGMGNSSVRGDIDCDGTIGPADIIIALQIMGGTPYAEDLSIPCGVVILGTIEWNGTSVDYRGSLTSNIAGCTQDGEKVFWDLNLCQDTCNRLGAGRINCNSMCSNINAEVDTDEVTLCTRTPTITEPQEGNTELGTVSWDSENARIRTTGTVTSSMQGCRQDNSGVYWDHQTCLDDCNAETCVDDVCTPKLRAGGMNCRSTCNLVRDDANADEAYFTNVCTY